MLPFRLIRDFKKEYNLPGRIVDTFGIQDTLVHSVTVVSVKVSNKWEASLKITDNDRVGRMTAGHDHRISMRISVRR